MTPPRVLVAGCGDVGGALAARMLATGATVWGLRRDVARLPADVRPLAGDLTRSDGLPELPADLDAVVFTAAAGASDDDAYRAVYVDGLRRLLAAVATTGAAPRVVFSSSTAVYGQDDGEEVDETSPTAPDGFRGRRLLAAEALLAARPWSTVAVRFGGIYGRGRTSLVERARTGPPAPAEPPRWTNRIHRDDAAHVLHHLLTHAAPPPVVVAVDREPAPLHEVLAWLRERLGLAPFTAAPAAPRERAARSDERANKRCSSRRLVESGYRFHYPTYREGYAALLGDAAVVA